MKNLLQKHNEEMEKEFIGAGAPLEHDRWARWQRYLHSKCLEMMFDGKKYVYFPVELYDRWEKQINTSYSELSEEEKESDRKETRNYLPLLLANNEKLAKLITTELIKKLEEVEEKENPILPEKKQVLMRTDGTPPDKPCSIKHENY